MKDEDRIRNAKQELREIGYTLLKVRGDESRFLVAHLGSETVLSEFTILDDLEELVRELKEEGWRRA